MINVSLYTDGGCSHSGFGGWAYVIVNEASGTYINFSGGEAGTTNNVMELTALLEGLRNLINHNVTQGVTIYSDSEYVKNTYTKWMHNWAKNGWKKADGGEVSNLEIIKELYELYPKIKIVDYVWVKGHDGNKYNELCDRCCTNEIKRLKGESVDDRPEDVLQQDPTYLKLNSMTKQEIIKYVIAKGFRV